MKVIPHTNYNSDNLNNDRIENSLQNNSKNNKNPQNSNSTKQQLDANIITRSPTTSSISKNNNNNNNNKTISKIKFREKMRTITQKVSAQEDETNNLSSKGTGGGGGGYIEEGSAITQRTTSEQLSERKRMTRLKDRIRHSLYHVDLHATNEDHLHSAQLYDLHFQKSHEDELWNHPIKRYELPLIVQEKDAKDHETTAICLFHVHDRGRSIPRIVTGSKTGLLICWNFNHLQYVHSIRYDTAGAKEKSIFAIATHIEKIDEKVYIIAGGGGINTGFAIIWDLQENTETKLFSAASKRHRKAVSGISVVPSTVIDSQEETLVIVASQDRTVSIWGFNAKKCLLTLGKQHTDLLLALAVHQTPDNALHIVTGSWDKSVLFWKIDPTNLQAAKDPYYKLRGHRKSVTAMCFHQMKEYNSSDPHNKPITILVTGSLDTSVIVWDFDTKQIVRTLKGHKEKVTAVSVYASKEVGHFPNIITCSEDCTTIIWDLASGQIIRTIHYNTKVFCGLVFESNFGMMIVTGGPRGPIISNLGNTERIKSFLTSPVTAINIYTPPEHEKRQPIVVIGTIDSTCSIFQLKNHQPIQSLKHHKSRINAMVIYSPPPHANENPLVISCDGKAKIKVWDLYTYEKKKEFKAHDGAVLTIALYDPLQVKGYSLSNRVQTQSIESTDGEDRTELDLQRPMIIAGGTDHNLTVWDLLSNQSSPRYLKKIKDVHSNFVRSIVVHHPKNEKDEPLVITGSYDQTVVVRDMKTCIKLHTLTGLHTNYVFFIALYDPFPHLKEHNQSPRLKEVSSDLKNRISIVTSSYDFTLGVWPLNLSATAHDHVHHLKGHTDSVTALSIYVPPTHEENPLIVSGSIDRMIIVWDLFTGQPLQKLVGHTDRVCYITTYLVDGKTPIVLSGSDDRKTIVWENALYQKPFMPVRDEVNRCFDSDCLEEDWPLITELTKKYKTQLFLENPHLFFLAVKYNRPNFLLKFRRYLTAVIPLMRCYGERNLLTYAVEKNDLISVRVILYCWTENLNRDITDILTQRLFHASYFFPDHNLKLLAAKYPLEFQNFIICLRLVRSHYSVLMTEDEYHDAYILYEHEKTVLYDDADDEDDKEEEHKANVEQPPHQEPPQSPPPAGTFERLLSGERINETIADDTVQYEYVEGEQNLSSKAITSPSEKSRSGTAPTDVLVNAAPKSNSKRLDILSSPDTNTCSLCLHPNFRYEIAGSVERFPRYDYLWKEKLSLQFRIGDLFKAFYYRLTSERVTAQPVTSLLVPLRNTAQLKESIQLFVKIANQLDSVDIFDSEVGKASLRFFWDNYAKSYHIIATLRYITFLLLFIASIYSYEFYYLTDRFNNGENISMHLLDGVVLGFFLYYLYEEVYQIGYGHRQFQPGVLLLHFITEVWNVLDAAIIITGLSGIILRFIYDDDITVGRCFLALCSIFMWFKVLYFMRPFANSGPLVTMIINVAYEIRFYLLVLFCVLSGFTQAFWLLSNVYDASPWGTVHAAYLTSFFYMLGQAIGQDETQTVSPNLATLLIVVFMMVMIILMLNLLIALMNDIFAKVRAKGLAIWRREQASIIIEESFLIPVKSKEVPPFLHVLKYSSDVKASDGQQNNQLLYDLVIQSIQNVTRFTELEDE